MVTHDADLAGQTGRIVHMADGRIMDGRLDPGDDLAALLAAPSRA